jgi:hypothetical protein
LIPLGETGKKTLAVKNNKDPTYVADCIG